MTVRDNYMIRLVAARADEVRHLATFIEVGANVNRDRCLLT